MINIIDKRNIALVAEVVQLLQNSTWIILINIPKILKILGINIQEKSLSLEVKLVLPTNVVFVPAQGDKVILKSQIPIDDINLSWKVQTTDNKINLDDFKIQISAQGTN